MEDRTSSILRYENNSIKPKGDQQPSLQRKLNKIKTIARENGSLANKYFQDPLIEQIIAWKEERNRMIHTLLNQQLTTEGLAALAEEGKDLARQLNNKAGNYKRAVQRRQEKRRD